MSTIASPQHCLVKLNIFNHTPHCGKGVICLLELIRDGKSLRSASISLNMSYSKAWHLIQAAEMDLGFSLISTRKGGSERSGSSITPEGEFFILQYRKFEIAAQCSVNQIFNEYFQNSEAALEKS